MMKRIGLGLMAGLMLFVLAACSGGGGITASKTPFPDFTAMDMDGNPVDNSIFAENDITIVNFWSNGCGTCIEEMPELQELLEKLKDRGINLIGVGADSGESDEKLNFAKKILAEKGVTYQNLSPDPESSFYKDFIHNLGGYPMTYVVDRDGNIVGGPIVGNVKRQEETLMKRIEAIFAEYEKSAT